MSLDDQIRTALAKAGIDGWEVLSVDPSVVLRDSNGSCLTITLCSIEWYEHWFDSEHEQLVALVRAVLASGVAADVATRLGVPFTTDALLGWVADRGWLANPFPDNNRRTWDAVVHTDEAFSPLKAIVKEGDSCAHALALACLAALDRAEGA